MMTDAQLTQYKQDGYTVCERLLPDSDLETMTAHIDAYVAEQSRTRRPEHLDKPHIDDARFLDFCANPAILDVVEQIVGPDIVLFASQIICKAKGDGLAVPWHQDAVFWPLEPPEVTTLWLAIDDSTVENGCLRVIPGTHTAGAIEHVQAENPQTKVLHLGLPPEAVDESQAVDLPLSRGGCSFHAPFLIHGSASNTSSERRCGYTMRFMPPSTRMLRTGPLSKWFAEHKLFLLRGRDVAGVNTYAN